MSDKLSDRDHDLMDAFLAEMADALMSGRLTKPAFVEAMAYVMTALDIDNRDEARFCFKAGVKNFEPGVSVQAPASTRAVTGAPLPGSVIVLNERRAGVRRASDRENGLRAETRVPQRSR